MIFLVVGLVLIAAYLVGSIPTGYWFARYFFNIDVTMHGSGNIGATNVARVLGNIKYFFLIFFIDAGKALAILWVAQRYAIVCVSQPWQQSLLCCVAASLLLGNGFSIFLGGRGGKSVATLVGCVLFMYPAWLVLAMLCSWGLVFAVSRMVFIASISAAVVAASLYWLFASSLGVLLGVFLSLATVWLIWRHKSNIKQFLAKKG